MIGQIFNSLMKAVKYWWVSLLVGILAIIVGIWCFVTPDASLAALTYVFVCIFLLGGILDIVFAVSNRKTMYGWGWSLTAGIFEVLLGFLLIALPLPIVTVILIYLVGFWILFRSIWGISESVHLQMVGIKGWGWLLALSILSVIFSFLFLVSPAFGGIFIVVFVGLALIAYGVFRIALGFGLRRIGKEIKENGGIGE